MTLYFRNIFLIPYIFFIWIFFNHFCYAETKSVTPDVVTAKDFLFKPYQIAFTTPDMKPYDIFCNYGKADRQDYLNILRQKAGLKDVESLFKYGAIMAFAPCEGKSIVRGKPYLIRAAKMNEVNALYLLGLIYNKEDDPTSKKMAESYFKQAANSGHAESSYNYAISLTSPNDLHIKIKYLLQAAEHDIIPAKHDYAVAMTSDPTLYTDNKKNKVFFLEEQLSDVYTLTDMPALRTIAAYNLALLKTQFKILDASPKEMQYLTEFAKKNNIITSASATKETKAETEKPPVVNSTQTVETITLDTNSLSQTVLSEYETWRDKNALNPTALY